MTPERYSQIREIFLEVCELSGAERQQAIANRCGGDAALRDEVESLLAHDATQTIIQTTDDTIENLHALTVGQPGQRSFLQKLQTFSLITKRLGTRGHVALGAFVACVVLIAIGYLVNQSIQSYQRTLRAEALLEILSAKSSALEMWFDHEEEKVESWARSSEFKRLANELIELATNESGDWSTLRASPLHGAIDVELERLAGEDLEYAIWDRRSITIADSLSGGNLIGEGVTPFGAAALALAFDGDSKILAYDHEHTITKRTKSDPLPPHVGVVTPVYRADGEISGALLVHDVDARDQASKILRMVQLGGSGETYAFNKRGVMLSESRFTEQLREIGLLPANSTSGSVRAIQLRDPGGDMTAGYRPTDAIAARPLTKMARHATAGESGVDVDGYRDYRGVLVIGAWRWLDEYDVGLATELDLRESEPGHWIVEVVAWAGLALVAICFGIIVLSYRSILHLRSELGEHRKLGQYTLEEQIGEGGMGRVFKARHEFLKRPTAIKLLKPEFVDAQSIARFKREASLASQLTHPNTIDIYDYGVTPEGIFFYVMEYVAGLSLAELVQQHGALSARRAVYLLRQVAESLSEAHDAGMIHRDLKPQNIMICWRGGKADVIKVLDFGLVKQTESSESQQLTSSALLAGTPQYIAPERLRDPSSANAQTDIYSFGAVAYFLLAGHEVFQGTSIADVLFQVVHEPPTALSEVRSDIPNELNELILSCLSKDPTSRPSSIDDIVRILKDLNGPPSWDETDAGIWWREHIESDANTLR